MWILIFCLGTHASALTDDQRATRAELERAAVQYFIDNTNPRTGIVLDKAEATGDLMRGEEAYVGSIAATGFGLAVTANAAKRGMLPWLTARDNFDRTMRFADQRAIRDHGWFLHFVNWETGRPEFRDANDFSTIDTALFIAGALSAATVFPDAEGARLAFKLYRELDFNYVRTDGGRFPDRRTLNLGMLPNSSFMPYQWSIFAEQQILVLLGLGHPDPAQRLGPEVWTAWERRRYHHREFSAVALDMPLFVHQYSQVFVDFRGFRDAFAVDYFENARVASLANRAEADAGFWGFSAGEAPAAGDANAATYRVFSPIAHAHTACIGCAIGSAQFLPAEVLDDARAWRASKWGRRIWGRYGFVDGVSAAENWTSRRALAITVGTAYLSLANIEPETSVFAGFMRIPEIRLGLERAGVPGRQVAR